MEKSIRQELWNMYIWASSQENMPRFATRLGLKQPAQLLRPDRFLKFLHTES